jgi:Cys-tRNA(Pro)/Cys-tRNA(Cys) deacylase
MSRTTRATKLLDASGITYQLHAYDYRADADAKGIQAALALQQPPQRVLKSLMAWVDKQAVCAVIPCDRRLSLKKLATACGGKSARMMEVAEAERRTGYKVGGISPLGQQRSAPVVLEQSALHEPSLLFNAGQRGLLVEISSEHVLAVLQARARALCD